MTKSTDILCPPVPPVLGDQQFEAMQSASIAAWAANSPKASAKNIDTALMAISHYQGVPLQSEYIFHDHPPSLKLPELAKAIRDRHHVLELFQHHQTAFSFALC